MKKTSKTQQSTTKELPKLVGSPKQIAWAETIRKDALVSNAIDESRFYALPVDIQSARRSSFDASVAALKQLETETSARWWIDNRYIVNTFVLDAAKNAL